jgi:DNA-binding MarR family transcriptional regulator
MTGKGHLYDLIKESFLLLDFGDRGLFARYGLSVSRYYALHHIARSPGLSPSRLSQLMFCDKSNITRLLHGLERDGLVERHSHEYDGRVQCLYLTETGARVYGEVSSAHCIYVEKRLVDLSAPDSEQLETILAGLNETLMRSLTG